MKVNGWKVGVAFLTLIATGGFALGDLVNGDFNDGTTGGWGIFPSNDASSDVVNTAESNNVLKLLAKNTYVGGNLQEAGLSSVTVTQPDMTNLFVLYAPSGTTDLEFNASVDGVGATWPRADVFISYTRLDAMPGMVFHTITQGDSAWRLRTLSLDNIDIAQTVSLQIVVESNNAPDGNGDAQVTGYFDDFAFVPEPASAALLAVGVLAALRRRPRRC